MGEKQYVGYICSYTLGGSKGIAVYDADIENGNLQLRRELQASNPSYLTLSSDGKFLYATADFGINAYEIQKDGDLNFINTATINGMRARYISLSKNNKFAFTAGYHDGKITVVKINEDGSVGTITDEAYDKGTGRALDRNYTPHVTCTVLTPDQRFLMACDSGIDQVKIFRFDEEKGTLKLVDILRCELDSAPRTVIFSKDGKFAYILSEIKNKILVYTYNVENDAPKFELIEKINILGESVSRNSAAKCIKLSHDENYLFCLNVGDNSITLFQRDPISGKLTNISTLPISGEYPKDIIIFPDDKHIALLNHDSASVTFFQVEYEKGLILMCGKPLTNDTPNCGLIKLL